MPHPTAIGENWSYYCSVDVACLCEGSSPGRCCEPGERGALPCCFGIGLPDMGSPPELVVYMDAKDLDLWLRVALEARHLNPGLHVESFWPSGEVNKVVLVWGECRAMGGCPLLTSVVGLL